MSLSVETLAVARKYTDDSLAGAGAVAGVPCKIQSITAITGGNRVTFLWTDNNGDDHTSAMDVMNGVDGEDGKGIQSVSVNAQNHLIITYTDGTTVDAGQIEIHSSVDSVNGQTGAVVLDAEDVGALPDNTPIPSKTSDLTNDSGFATTSDVSTALADYTKTADLTTLLAAKQDTLTFDNVPTENSNNPVKSGGVYSAIQTLTSAFTNNVNVNGCKNILHVINKTTANYANIIYTPNSDGSISVSNTTASAIADYYLFAPDNKNANAIIPLGNDLERNVDYILSTGRLSNAGVRLIINLYDKDRVGLGAQCETQTHATFNLSTLDPNNLAVYYRIYLRVSSGATPVDNAVIYPMLCLKSDYDLDPTYVPPAKTNLQLTQDSVTWDDLREVGAVNYLVYPYSETTHTSSNIIYTDNGDGSITVGTGTTSSGSPGSYAIANNTKDIQRLRGKAVKFSIDCDTVVNGSNANVQMAIYDSSNNLLDNHYLHMNGGRDETILTVPSNADHVYIQAWNKRSTTISTAYTVKPMITPVSYNGPYVPYAKSNRELTEELTVASGEITRLVSFSTLSSYRARKYGKVVELYFAGTLSEAVNIWTDFLTVPDGFRPSHYVQIVSFNTYNSCKNLQLAPSGGIQSAYNLASGDFIRFTVTYIID